MSQLASLLDLLTTRTSKVYGRATFDSRFRTQKAVYLLKALGYPPVQHYNYSNYFHGPYCPELTTEYYAVQTDTPRAEIPPVPTQVLARVEEAMGRDAAFLEAATTLHSVYASGKRNQRDAFAAVQGMKPHLPVTTLQEAWRFLQHSSLLS